MTVRDDLRRLVDQLPEEEVDAARRYLQYLLLLGNDPVLASALAAPLDDEPETDEERAAVEGARADVAAGRMRTDEELRRELGL